MTRRGDVLTTAIKRFALLGFAGPAIQLLTWGQSALRPGESKLGNFVHDVVFYLWPAQMLASHEVSLGRWTAIALSVCANMLVFSAIGLLVALTRNVRVVPYACVVLLLAAWAWWGAGYAAANLAVGALLIAASLLVIVTWQALNVEGEVGGFPRGRA